MTTSRRSLIAAPMRSFLLTGLWTAQRGQNLGFLFSLWPVLKKLYPRREDRARVARAHLGFFSTHPYTAGVALGVVAGLEEARLRDGGPIEDVVTARTAMAGPLAALGETFFWGTWLPFCVAGALVLAALRPGWTLGLAAAYLGVFNAAHLAARFGGFYWGYRWRAGVVERLAALRVQRAILVLAGLGMALAAVRLCLLPPAGHPVWQGFLWAALFWGVLRLGVRPSFVALGAAAASVGYSLLRAAL